MKNAGNSSTFCFHETDMLGPQNIRILQETIITYPFIPQNQIILDTRAKNGNIIV